MHGDTPVVKDLVLLGGGHSHVTVLKRFGMEPIPGVRLTLVSRDIHTPYSGMLPGLIAGHYTFDEAHIDLQRLARFAQARLIGAEAIGLDPRQKMLKFANRPDLPYDLLAINTGSTPGVSTSTGADRFATPVKPINQFWRRWQSLVERVTSVDGLSKIGVVGAGAGGVELTLAMQYKLSELLGDSGNPPEFHLFSGSGTVLPTHNRGVQRRFERVLKERGIQVHCDCPIVEVDSAGVSSATGERYELDEVLWTTQASAPGWFGDSGLAVDARGFIEVNETLESISHSGIFAAGDVAAVVGHPREKAGVFAVRQGPPLERNLRRALLDEPLEPFRPQRQFLSLVSTGDEYAVASKWKVALEGRWVWKWKDYIDREFMRRFSDLPAMDQELEPTEAEPTLKDISAVAMRCGGCGAKVGSTVLERVLERIREPAGDGVVIGLDQPDDAASIEVPCGMSALQSVDFFRAIVDDPYLFGRIAANHSLGDLYAMGAKPHSALAIAVVPYGPEQKVEDLLVQMLLGAQVSLREAGASLIGGHSSEGTELALGFSVTGFGKPDQLLRKSGMRPGDRLILTKPLGVGALFAAEMRMKAKGRWIAAALDSMIQSNQLGAEILLASGATACTDVTGFGLLGHLSEMVKASDVDVELELESLPALDGALEVISEGVFSSLQPQNVRLRRIISNLDEGSGHGLYPLLFDPQTSGGLVASVPAARTAECLAELQGAGYERACEIGSVLKRSERLEAITLRTG